MTKVRSLQFVHMRSRLGCCSVDCSVVDICPTNRVAEPNASHPDTLEFVYDAYSSLRFRSVLSSVPTSGGRWLTLVGVPISYSSELLGASYQVYRH